MTMYHATKSELPIGGQLRTPTGRDDGCVVSGGAVYLCDNAKACARYGVVYEIEVANATPYKDALAAIGRSKKSRYTRGVYIARPSDTKIVAKRS